VGIKQRIQSLFSSTPAAREKSTWVYTDSNGYMNTGWDLGWWQQNLKGPNGPLNETVEGCVSTLAQTLAMCPVHHMKDMPTGESVRQTGSNVERVCRYPNPYESRTLFFNNLIRTMYFSGNGIGVASRDDRGAVNRIDLVNGRSTRGVFSAEDGNIYYAISPKTSGPYIYNDSTDLIVPQRNVLHIRLHSGEDPLRGETPITSAARSIAASSALTSHQAAFFNNMARPSGGLFTESELKKEQIEQLRDAVSKQTQNDNSGKIPIFSHGLKWESMSLTAQDAEIASAYGMTTEGIARAFRVPLPLINDLRESTFNNAESMMQWFLASGLGFLLEHVELELGRLFNLPFAERVNFDTRALLRSDWKSRMEALGEGVVKGIYTPNEARRMEGLPPAEDGDEPRVQQQVVPLSAWDQNEPAPLPAPEPTMDDEAIEASLEAGITKGLTHVA
jgi:HK97 family phage portal protein